MSQQDIVTDKFYDLFGNFVDAVEEATNEETNAEIRLEMKIELLRLRILQNLYAMANKIVKSANDQEHIDCRSGQNRYESGWMIYTPPRYKILFNDLCYPDEPELKAYSRDPMAIYTEKERAFSQSCKKLQHQSTHKKVPQIKNYPRLSKRPRNKYFQPRK